MRHFFASMSTEAKFALGIFLVCGPVCHFSLWLWAGDVVRYFKAVSFQPQVFIWLPLCAPYIAKLGWPALHCTWQELKSRNAHRTAFVGINLTALILMFLFDLSSPNVMPYEVRKDELGELLTDFDEFQVAATESESDTTESAEDEASFGDVMSTFRWKPSTWSPFRVIYYAVLLIGWTLMFLQVTTSTYTVYLCTASEEGPFRTSMERNCVRLLGAILPALPFVVLRRINHLNKVQLYGVDAMNFFDYLLGILIIACVVGLLLSAHSLAEKLQTALSIIGSLGAAVLFVNPSPAAEVLFHGGVFQTLCVVFGIPIVLGLLLFPWLVISDSEQSRASP